MRVAIEEGAALVPVVVMGEVDALRNFIDMPRVQSWTYKKLGFPVPYLVVGRWGLSPLPCQTGLKFVIGEPIQPPPHTTGQQVCAEQLALLRLRRAKLNNFPGNKPWLRDSCWWRGRESLRR